MAIMSFVHRIQTIYNVVQNPHVVLLSKKERMVPVRGVKRPACCASKEIGQYIREPYATQHCFVTCQ